MLPIHVLIEWARSLPQAPSLTSSNPALPHPRISFLSPLQAMCKRQYQRDNHYDNRNDDKYRHCPRWLLGVLALILVVVVVELDGARVLGGRSPADRVIVVGVGVARVWGVGVVGSGIPRWACVWRVARSWIRTKLREVGAACRICCRCEHSWWQLNWWVVHPAHHYVSVSVVRGVVGCYASLLQVGVVYVGKLSSITLDPGG